MEGLTRLPYDLLIRILFPLGPAQTANLVLSCKAARYNQEIMGLLNGGIPSDTLRVQYLRENNKKEEYKKSTTNINNNNNEGTMSPTKSSKSPNNCNIYRVAQLYHQRNLGYKLIQYCSRNNSNGKFKQMNCDNSEVVKRLLNWGADVNVLGGEPLVQASKWGRADIVDLLLSRGANPAFQNFKALHWAIVNNHGECVELMLYPRTPTTEMVWTGETMKSMYLTACKHGNVAIVDMLIQKIVQQLCDAGPSGDYMAIEDVNAEWSEWGFYETGLGLAISNGNTEVVKLLLMCTAYTGSKALLMRHQYAINHVSKMGNLELFKVLVEAGVDPHNDGEYPLRTAAGLGYIDLVKYLVQETGADIHAENDGALRQAIFNEKGSIMMYLLERGADLSRALPSDVYQFRVRRFLENHGVIITD